MSQKNNDFKDQNDKKQNMSQNTDDIDPANLESLPETDSGPPEDSGPPLPPQDSGPPPKTSEENKVEYNYSGFNFETLVSKVDDNSILYQKYSNKRVEPDENNNNGYLVYPTLDENDSQKYDKYLKELSNIFNKS